jgi:hypothetical protein
LTLLLTASTAAAASIDSKERQARTACLAGDWAKGVAILAELFVRTEDPTYVFNQGRCFEQNGRNEQAIDRFREYLRIGTKLPEAEVALAQKHIADCRALLGHSDTPTPPALAESPKVAPVPAPETRPEPVAAPSQPEVSLQQEAPPSAGSQGTGLRTAGVITAAVGGGALIAGVILNLKVNQMTSDLEAPGAYSRSTDSRRSTYSTLTWVGYGAGAACVAGGAVLYFLGWKSAQSGSAAVALVPTLSPGQAGAALKGAF